MILDLAWENLGVRCYDVRWALVNYAHHALNRQGILKHLFLSLLFFATFISLFHGHSIEFSLTQNTVNSRSTFEAGITSFAQVFLSFYDITSPATKQNTKHPNYQRESPLPPACTRNEFNTYTPVRAVQAPYTRGNHSIYLMSRAANFFYV
jgi:hypothetical protein